MTSLLPLRRYAGYTKRHRLKFNDGRGYDFAIGDAIEGVCDRAERLEQALERIADRETDGVELGNGWDVFREVVLEAREALNA